MTKGLTIYQVLKCNHSNAFKDDDAFDDIVAISVKKGFGIATKPLLWVAAFTCTSRYRIEMQDNIIALHNYCSVIAALRVCPSQADVYSRHNRGCSLQCRGMQKQACIQG